MSAVMCFNFPPRYVESQVNKTMTSNGTEIFIPANPEEKWKGFFYAFLLLVTTVFQVNADREAK